MITIGFLKVINGKIYNEKNRFFIKLFLKNKYIMLNISFKNGQGLGNQLWMFAAAKSISEKLNVELNIFEFSKFKGIIDFLILDNNNNYNFSIKEYNFSKDIEIFNERLFYDKDLKYIASDYDERVLEIKK